MGFFSELFPNAVPINDNIPAIMPQGAINQINNGIIPTMHTDKIMLVKGEACHFADRAIMMTEKVTRHFEGKSNGVSVRLCKGVTYRTGRSKGTPVEEITIEKTKGLIYVTNKRIIFVADKNAFDKKYRYLTAVVPYTDGIKFQFGSKTYALLVPDGNALGNIINLINNI